MLLKESAMIEVRAASQLAIDSHVQCMMLCYLDTKMMKGPDTLCAKSRRGSQVAELLVSEHDSHDS